MGRKARLRAGQVVMGYIAPGGICTTQRLEHKVLIFRSPSHGRILYFVYPCIHYVSIDAKCIICLDNCGGKES